MLLGKHLVLHIIPLSLNPNNANAGQFFAVQSPFIGVSSAIETATHASVSAITAGGTVPAE